MKEKQILIIGAGIGGLALASNLRKLKIPFRIIEKKSNWDIKGLAMSIQGEGLDAASSLGILDEIKSQGEKRNLERIEDPRGKILKKLITDPSDQGFIIRRDVIHEALRLRIPQIEMGVDVTHLEEKEDSIKVTFSDSSTDIFSLVVGADGINSNTLSFVSKEQDTEHSGSAIWGITVSKKYKDIIEVWDKNKMVALYPVDHGTVISFFSKAPKSFQSPRRVRADHIKKYFSNFRQAMIQDILKNLPIDIFFDHIRYTRPEKWNKGRVTLIGDACHSLSPLSGLGANLAMADAEGLAKIIYKNIENDNFLITLEEYNSSRQKKADEAYYLSKLRTQRGMLGFPGTISRNRNIKKLGWTY